MPILRAVPLEPSLSSRTWEVSTLLSLPGPRLFSSRPRAFQFSAIPILVNMDNSKENKQTPSFYTPGRLFSLRARNRDDLITEIKIAGKAIIIGVIGGLPIALLVLALTFITDIITFSVGFANSNQASIFNTGINVGIGFLLLIGTLTLSPLVWRKFSNPKVLTLIAYFVVVAISVAIGMLMPYAVLSWWVAWWLGGIGTTAWWTWEQRWRGSGVAPSPLSGVLRPEIHPGQIWFATIKGSRETKVRPIMVLSRGPRTGLWNMAYFTSQAPKYDNLKAYYSHIPAGTIRGIEVDNWVSLGDLRTQARKYFRSYTGIAPTWLYKKVCEAYSITPDPDAYTVNEERAGEAVAPTYLAVLSALGIKKDKDRVNRSSNSWETTWRLVNLPIESRKDRRARAKRQMESSKNQNQD